MSRKPDLTRSERRALRPTPPTEGPYGVDTEDIRSTTWTARYVMWALSPTHAAERLRESGFHKRKTSASWDPHRPPPQGWPDQLSADTVGWYRTDIDGDPIEREELPADYRHLPQG